MTPPTSGTNWATPATQAAVGEYAATLAALALLFGAPNVGASASMMNERATTPITDITRLVTSTPNHAARPMFTIAAATNAPIALSDASGNTYPVINVPSVACSEEITGHSVSGERQILLARSAI